MIEPADKTLRQFFSEAVRQDIADDGFTDRVMRRLPPRRGWLERLWTPLCLTVFAVLFVAFDGWTLVLDRLLLYASELLLYVDHLSQHADRLLHTSIPLVVTSAATALFALLLVGVGEAAAYARRAL